ncbi:Phenylacetic acid catabolic protein [Pseudomonas sp. RGM2987]|uniref:Phenylacetic acid catabolic protein n=1 Tax=Pseudomonas sp. RGM2987 TaxID=2930090 RepID=UPI001FD71AA5|nr:Phenylacetic acid catabolic protein [Pseudomonas sp. RGM2987]MCJ8207512.1 phenylacetate-CoA oxygenase subunit PaaI [Pseudomonas sp. RGM2987]
MSTDEIVCPSARAETDEKLLFDELLCVADSKFILGNWYFIALPNGRSVSDWTALCAMMQNHYGHARALYRYLSRYGFTRQQAEWQRSAVSIRSARVLDSAPASWVDFVVTSDLSEQAFSARLASLAASTSIDPQLSRLATKIVRETDFHQLYLDGWRRLLVDGRAEETQHALDQRLPILLEWWGPNHSASDRLHLAGLRSASDHKLSQDFIEGIANAYHPLGGSSAVQNATGSDTWALEVRRSGPRGIPATLHELIRFKEPELAIP